MSEHIRQYNEYAVTNNPYHLTDKQLEERLDILNVFVPFLEENSILNEKEQQILDTYISENPVRTEINLEKTITIEHTNSPMANNYNSDKFYENRDTQSVTWMYYNPDGNDGQGQFIETVIYKEDIENAINKANSSCNSTQAFVDTFYNCTQTITDRGTENFPAAEKYYNEAESDFAVEGNSKNVFSEIRNYLTDYYNSFDNVPALTQADIDILRTLEPRKSILNFTSEEIKLTEKWQQRFEADIDKKSPYYRTVNGDWREHEATSVPVLPIEDRNADFKKVRDDIKSRVIERGSFINKDANWSIQISRNGLEDTVKYGFTHNDTVIYNMIYDSSKLIENSVFLDSVISEKNNNNKANNTAFMHKFYSLCSFNGEPYLAKITVEEFADGQTDTLKRMYNIQDIKTEPLRHIEFTDKQLARSILNGSDISISDLFKIVKTCDNDFYLNKGKNSLSYIRQENYDIQNYTISRGEIYDIPLILSDEQRKRFEVFGLIPTDEQRVINFSTDNKNWNKFQLRESYGNDSTNDYAYNENGNIISQAVNGDIAYKWTYDTDGNILKADEYAYTNGELGEVVSTKKYSYEDAEWRDLLTSFNGQNITYDEIGNPLSYRDGMKFTWIGRQLSSLQKNGNVVNYTYNSDGIRTSKTVNGVKTNYQLDGNKIVSETTNDNIKWFIYDENDSIIGFEYNAQAYYFEKNAQGDIVRIFDAYGNFVSEYFYDAWGNIASISGSQEIAEANPFRYRGYYYDNESELYYLQTRYYDSFTGRFLNADSIIGANGDITSNNLFTYCSNNPVNFIDPTGEIAANIIGAVIAGIVGLVGGAYLTKWLANKLGLKGWKRKVFIIGLTAIITAVAATIGYFVGPYIGKKANTIVKGLRGLGKSCFIAGTSIVTENGYVPIEQIEIGDYVYAENPETGETKLKLVKNTFVSETFKLIHLSVDNEIISTTPEHPFYVWEKGWVQANELKIGDSLILLNGDKVAISSIELEILKNPQKVYNFEVEDYHTYYVGNNSVLVHNTCIKDFLKSPKKYKDVEKLLKKYGFEKIRQKGSHVTFKDAVSGKTFTVPNHGSKPIAIGTLRSILKSAGLL